MPKKSSGRKKGIQRSIPMHRVGSQEIASGEEGEDNEAEKSEFSRSKYFSLGEKCFETTFTLCENFHLLGFTRTQNGEYVPLSRKAQIQHSISIVCYLTFCMQRTWVMLRVFLYKEQPMMESFLCLCLDMFFVVPVFLAVGVILRPIETMNLLNSWSYISASLKIIDPDSKFHPLDNTSARLKVISDVLLHQGLVFAAPILSLVMSDLPILLFPMAKSYGFLPEKLLPNWTWKVIFAPLESFVTLPFMLIGSIGPSCLFMEIGALDIYLQRIRGINLDRLRSRQWLEQMYVQLELFNKVAQVWIRFFFPPWIFSLSCSVIVTVFVTIRYTELPMYYYVFCPYTALTLMLLIFWQSYDMLRVMRASEDLLARLWRHEAPHFRGMTRAERVELMKRSKAMRPLVFPVADSQFSLSLPLSTWNEILNQTIFLLSL